MKIVRDTRGGKAYRARWGERMRGQGPFAELLAQRFSLALKRNGLHERKLAALNCESFIADPAASQLDLF